MESLLLQLLHKTRTSAAGVQGYIPAEAPRPARFEVAGSAVDITRNQYAFGRHMKPRVSTETRSRGLYWIIDQRQEHELFYAEAYHDLSYCNWDIDKQQDPWSASLAPQNSCGLLLVLAMLASVFAMV